MRSKALTEKHPAGDFMSLMYLNPTIRKPIKKVFGTISSPNGGVREEANLFFIKRLEYLPFVFLMEQSTFVLTDSGGIK
jgi:UDP-N-acetylglucosamine 2-epimerase (non-hydrolysing)